MVGSSASVVQAANEYFDALVKSRFIEMFGDPLLNTMNWKTKTLDEITVKIRNGTTPVGAKKVYTEGGVIFLQSQNVWRNKIDYSDTQFISYELNQKMIDTQLEIGDVLITKTGRINTENSSLGRVSLFRGSSSPVNISSEIYLVRVTKEINPEFLMHLLLMDSYQKYIRTCSPGGTDKRHLYSRYVEKFIIIQPPIELQNQFADFVRQVDKSKLLFQQMVSKYDELVKSRFIEMFGDESFESKQLFDLFKTSSGGTPLKSKKQYYDGGTIPWLTSGEVDRLHINSARSKITQIALKETSAKIPPIGSVLVSMYGSVGYAGILEFEAAINQAICAIHPNPDFSPEWLCYYVRSKKEELTNQAVGAALNNISQDKIRKLMVPCPPIELQNEFTKFVRQVDKSKSEILEGIKRLKSNRITDNEPNSGS